MSNITNIYKDYIQENKMYFIVSLLFSLRIEPISFLITNYSFAVLYFSKIESKWLNMILYLVIVSIWPILISIKNIKRMRNYIDEYVEEEEISKYNKIIFIINFLIFTLPVSILVTFFLRYLPFLITFDMLRMPFVYLGYEDIIKYTIIGYEYIL